MGSTMKSIVESITKSKSKIFSKSLILDGDELTKEIQPQLLNENYLQSKINMNLKLKISDFFPIIQNQHTLINNFNFSSNSTNTNLQLDLISHHNENENENNYQTENTNFDFNFQFQDENFFPQHQQINFNFMDLSETEKSTNISVLSKPLLYIDSSNDENQNENEELYKNYNTKRENEIFCRKKENNFFLLGKKKARNKIRILEKGNKKNKPFSVFRKSKSS
jgi:hypothetical protein